MSDEGLNFRHASDSRVLITDSTISLPSNPTPWLYYKFSATKDTLIISSSSSYAYLGLAVVDSNSVSLEEWIPVLTYANRSWFRTVTRKTMTGADLVDSTWYLRYRSGFGSLFELREYGGGDSIKTIEFPNATAGDIAGGYLWLAGAYYVEQRQLQDTSVVRRIDLSQSYSFPSLYALQHIAVYDSTVCIYSSDRLLTFDLNGVLLHDVQTYEGIWSMSFFGDQLIVGTNLSTVHAIDISSGMALSSHLVPEYLYGNSIYPIDGVVRIGDRLGVLRQLVSAQGIDLFEFDYPQ